MRGRHIREHQFTVGRVLIALVGVLVIIAFEMIATAMLFVLMIWSALRWGLH